MNDTARVSIHNGSNINCQTVESCAEYTTAVGADIISKGMVQKQHHDGPKTYSWGTSDWSPTIVSGIMDNDILNSLVPQKIGVLDMGFCLFLESRVRS